MPPSNARPQLAQTAIRRGGTSKDGSSLSRAHAKIGGALTSCILAAGACGTAARSRGYTPARLGRAHAPGSYKCVLWGSREPQRPRAGYRSRLVPAGNHTAGTIGTPAAGRSPMSHRFGCGPAAHAIRSSRISWGPGGAGNLKGRSQRVNGGRARGQGRTAAFVARTSADDRWPEGLAPHRSGALRHGLTEARILGNHEKREFVAPRTGFSAGGTRGVFGRGALMGGRSQWL